MSPLPPVLASSNPALSQPENAKLHQAAVELEAAFLTEMLKSTSLGKPSESFGGGAGEEQFGSILVREQARLIAKAGGIGLAESFFHALSGAANDK